VAAAVDVTPSGPILIDKFLENAIEARPTPSPTAQDAFVPAVMEHIELAGIHSGRLGLRHPAGQHPEKHLETIERVHPRSPSSWAWSA
jgi:carbamoyl-phosphate synthase large subunit